MELRILRKTTIAANEHGQFAVHHDRLQAKVNAAECHHEGCLVKHEPRWEWQDLPIVEDKATGSEGVA